MPVDIDINDLTFRFSDSDDCLFKGLSHCFKAGTWTSILGASGCGKTTLLKLIAGLVTQSTMQGNIQFRSSNESKVTLSQPNSYKPIAHKPITHKPITYKPIAYMGQKDFLFPWLDVLHNTCLERYLQTGRLTLDEIKQAEALLAQVGLGDVIRYKPKQLSGGMRQRVALARTLIQNKPVVLMDEPFSALDSLTRYELQDLACQLLDDKTVIFITHDIQEALRVSDHVLVMKGKPASLNDVHLPYCEQKPRVMNAEFAHFQQRLMSQLQSQSIIKAVNR
ncbi:ABC transporter ATP-binding protein [Vibrio gangliei]|uniref:ABC transporter ATP-binding protein n=1 Tax=Vibrio gangliei TaxID=2077090 RepID=UPI001FE8E191|nr:ABC transporter ATP-binding protein [Vibrio gangliei]